MLNTTLECVSRNVWFGTLKLPCSTTATESGTVTDVQRALKKIHTPKATLNRVVPLTNLDLEKEEVSC